MAGRRRCAVTACAVAVLAGTLTTSVARAGQAQESIFQDDDHLLYSSSAEADHTLSILQSLGVDRVRVTVKWSAIAPAPTAVTRPTGFDAGDPAAYPSGAWVPYDRVVTLAAAHGLGVDFNVTAPGPLWAMSRGSPTSVAADHWAPDPNEFKQFVYAVGTRYSGHYGQVPRVSFWSIWNEPDQPGWLAPQWRRLGGRQVPNSPRLYREYVDAAFSALELTGHLGAGDTVLVGELAPEGFSTPGYYTAMTPLPFIRALFCLDGRYGRLRGGAAAALGCPRAGSRGAFVAANPGLFSASGFGHHPYDFFHSPSYSSPDPNFAPLANLGRLEQALDRAYGAYGVRRRIPVYLTEYGYQTKPPDPLQIFSPATQAAFLNEADYLAWRDPRVRAVAQFLLYDSPPDPRFPPEDFRYWDTFQTGLLFADGRAKPALAAYRLPIWIPVAHARRRGSILVWGQPRPAPPGSLQRAVIQWRRPHGSFRSLATVTVTSPRSYFVARVRPLGAGWVRIAWRSPAGRVLFSRSVAVRLG